MLGRALATALLLVPPGCSGDDGGQTTPDATSDASADGPPGQPGPDAPPTLDAEQPFGHGSPRPACEYVVDESRTPWALPQVVGTGWGAPVKLPTLNTPCPEDAIEISRDGSTLYFYWSPTVDASYFELLYGSTGTYRALRAGTDPGAFEDPRFFDLRQDTDGACDGELSFSPAGDLVYFHSTRSANTGYQHDPPVDDLLDIYVAPVVDGVPGPVANLGEPLNSVHADGEHCLSPDGTKLYLASTRPDGLGGSDIWESTRTGDTFGAPVNLGAPINSAGADLQPAFAADHPTTMYFASDRAGQMGIFCSTHDGTAWGTPEPIIGGYVGEPTLVADGSLLYFVHVLVDADGVFGADVWYVERAP